MSPNFWPMSVSTLIYKKALKKRRGYSTSIPRCAFKGSNANEMHRPFSANDKKRGLLKNVATRTKLEYGSYSSKVHVGLTSVVTNDS